jgi:hypothetical protein
MRFLSASEALAWCEGLGLQKHDQSGSKALTYGEDSSFRFRVPIPDEATAAISLAYMIVITDAREYNEGQFAGALLWLQRWQIWSESIDSVGYALLDGIRQGAYGTPSFEEAPATYFTDGEFKKALACLSIPMLFQWDIYFLPTGGTFFVYVSHEGYLEFIAHDSIILDTLEQRFRTWTQV